MQGHLDRLLKEYAVAVLQRDAAVERIDALKIDIVRLQAFTPIAQELAGLDAPAHASQTDTDIAEPAFITREGRDV